MAWRALLEDIAAAGDFGTYRDRRAARLSMIIAAFSDPERSPLAPLPDDHGGAATALLYTELLGRLPELVDKLDTYRNLWEDEDRQLTSSEHILTTGAAVIDEHGEVDLTAFAGRLTECETNGVTWSADPAGSLTPRLSPIGNNRESSIPAAEVVSRVVEHLTMAAPAWDPYP